MVVFLRDGARDNPRKRPPALRLAESMFRRLGRLAGKIMRTALPAAGASAEGRSVAAPPTMGRDVAPQVTDSAESQGTCELRVPQPNQYPGRIERPANAEVVHMVRSLQTS